MSQLGRNLTACRTLGHMVALALVGVTPALAAPAPAATPPPDPLPPTSILEASPPVPVPPPLPPAAPGVASPSKLLEADVGLRLGLRIQNPDPNQPDKLNDLGMDGQVQLLLSGQAMRHVLWQADFVGSFGTVEQDGSYDTSGSAAVLDLIARFELHDAFNLWVGRMLVPADRSGLSTEWAIAPWLFPGQFFPRERPVGALQGLYGRSDGVTLWGQLGGGTFKYYLGAFNLADPSKSPLYSGRLSLSLLNPEPGYRNASTYYGNKDVLAFGVGFQHQHNGTQEMDILTNKPLDVWADFTELNFDLLFEKNLGPAGVMDLEGAFCKIWGSYARESITYFVLASYLLPIEVGAGKFQPLFRLQQAHDPATDATDALADAQLGYIMDGLRARVALDYRYSKVWGQTRNAVLLGLQLMTR